MEHSDRLNPWQKKILGKLVSIPSPSGQEQQIISFIHDTFVQNNRRQQEQQRCRLFLQRVAQDSDAENLIVEKGNGNQLTLLLYAHVDTVGRGETWENEYELKREPNGRLRGLGVYDMKAGVMALMDVMQHIDVPDGVKLIAVFGVDEEANSDGAQAFLEWEGVKQLQAGRVLVVSPEIPTLDEADSDSPKDVVIGRCGSLKTGIMITTPGGHRYRRDAPNAITAQRELKNHLFEQFARKQKTDPVFSEEKLEETHEAAFQNRYAQTADRAMCGLEQFLVGNSVETALAWQQACAEELSKMKKWQRLQITHVLGLTSERTSYQPFMGREDNQLLTMALGSVDHIYGGHRLVRGRSTADTNILALLQEKLGPIAILEVGAIGDDAHMGTEWVSEASICRMRAFYAHLIAQQIPEYLGRR